MLRRLGLLVICAAVAMASAVLAQTQPTPAPGSAPAASNPYQRVPNSAPAVANPRDQQPFTKSTAAGLNPALPTLFIAGDSTAAPGNATTRGWAALLVDYFDASKVNLCNLAVSGARFNSYGATWDGLVAALKPGDFVVIQMGHNSGPLPGIGNETQGAAPAGRGATAPASAASGPAIVTVPGRRGGGAAAPVHTHGWYVRKYITDVRAKNATPIAMTLTLRDLWLDGKVERLKEQVVGEGGMSDWTRQVAAQEKALLIDHSNIIGDLYDKLGMTETDKLFGDHYLHTNTAGAILNCECFIAGLKATPDVPLVGFLNEKGKAIAAYKLAATLPAR